MARLTIAGHLSLDTIETPHGRYESLGGPPAYAGLQARQLGADVTLITRCGGDFPDAHLVWLSRNQLTLRPGTRAGTYPTTRFHLRYDRSWERTLTLRSRCEDLSPGEADDLGGDAALVSPICGEVPAALLPRIARNHPIVYLDPQGFLRRFDSDGRATLQPTAPTFLARATIVKVDAAEALVLTRTHDLSAALPLLARQGPQIVVGTNRGHRILVYHQGAFTELPSPPTTIQDPTGAGDIFAATFLTAFVREPDAVWAASRGIAAASAAISRVGLAKIVSAVTIEDQASAVQALARRVPIT